MSSEIYHVRSGPHYALSSRLRSATNPAITVGEGPNYTYNGEDDAFVELVDENFIELTDNVGVELVL